MLVWPDAQHAVVSLPDPKKGEQLVLLTTHANAASKQLADASPGVAAILLPRKVLVLDKLPVLATGKTDYAGCLELATGLLPENPIE